MSFPTETVLAFLGGSGFFWLLLAGLVLSLGLGRYAWRHGPTASADGTRDVWLGAAAMLACFLAWAVFSTLFHLGKLPPKLWMAPFDRLFVIGCLVALGWALTSTRPGAAQWRRFLTAGLVATVLAYAAWAPLWAREFHSRPWLVTDPTGLTRVWDAWQVVLALAVVVAVMRRTRRAPGWVLGALVGLIAASVLELIVPLSPVFPAWSRMGTLVAGTFFVGAAVTQVMDPPFGTASLRWPTRLPRIFGTPRLALHSALAATARDRERTSRDIARALNALEAQGTTLTTISRNVASLDKRVGTLEAALLETDRHSAGAVDPALVGSLTEALRAPMTMILGYSDLLTRGAGLTDEQLERFLQRIDANLARMHVMLGNLLTVVDASSVASVGNGSTTDSVDIASAVEKAVRRAQPQLAEKGLKVNQDVAAALAPALSDPEATGRIFDNLLVNACQRSPQGGDLSIHAAIREDQLGARAMVISVHDRGSQLEGGAGAIEIDDAASTPVALKIAGLFARLQGGRVWAESDPLGARFFVRLPVASEG